MLSKELTNASSLRIISVEKRRNIRWMLDFDRNFHLVDRKKALSPDNRIATNGHALYHVECPAGSRVIHGLFGKTSGISVTKLTTVGHQD
jgi:hypothetical protein